MSNLDGYKIADEYECEFYLRPELLGSSSTKSDDVVLDFVVQYGGDIVVWVNPISPLQTAQEIKTHNFLLTLFGDGSRI